jgi:membrane associated rhomboid family serine protease
MFSLWFIGGFVEKIIGRRRFLIFYLAAGLFAGIIATLGAGYFGYGIGANIFGSPTISMLGASGAIFGLAGLLAVLVPYSRVYLIAGPLIAIIVGSVVGSFVSNETLLTAIGFAINVYILLSILLMFSFNARTRKFILPIEMPFWLLPIVAIVPLMVIGLFVFLPIGNIAHLAGLIAGLAYGFYLKTKYKKKVMMLRRFFR